MYNLMAKLAVPLMRLDVDPVGNMETPLKNIYEKMGQIGPYIGGIALIGVILAIALAGERRTATYVKRAILIGVCIILIVNIPNVINIFQWIFTQLFPDSTWNTWGG